MGKGLTQERGFALVTTTVIIAILLLSGISLMNYAVSVRKASKSVQDEFNAVQLAETGVQKAIFCLNAADGTNCGGTFGSNYVGETDVDLGTGTFTTTLAGTSTVKTVTSVGTTPNGSTKTVLAEISAEPDSDSISFGFALQSGNGGMQLDNISTINGTVYSNGHIACQSTAATIDGDAYVGAIGGQITNCTVNYDAHADKILGSDVLGDAYYDVDPTDIAGTTVAGTKFSGSDTPEPTELSTVDLDFWRESALAGGTIVGDYYPADGSTLGPKKIEGNLNLGNNIDLTITGPIWVEGNVTTGNNCSFTLDSSYGRYSTALLADKQSDPANYGKIDILNGTGIFGSGDSRSHLLFISTNTSISTSSPALSVANNSDGAVFMSPNGLLKLANNAAAKSLAAYKLYVDNGATVDFVESEMADANFANSPGGVWKLGFGGWRQMH